MKHATDTTRTTQYWYSTAHAVCERRATSLNRLLELGSPTYVCKLLLQGRVHGYGVSWCGNGNHSTIVSNDVLHEVLEQGRLATARLSRDYNSSCEQTINSKLNVLGQPHEIAID
jgi:hypothetical protein